MHLSVKPIGLWRGLPAMLKSKIDEASTTLYATGWISRLGIHSRRQITKSGYLGQFLFWIGVPISIVAFLRGADLSGPIWIAPVVAWVAILLGAGLAGLINGKPTSQAPSRNHAGANRLRAVFY